MLRPLIGNGASVVISGKVADAQAVVYDSLIGSFVAATVAEINPSTGVIDPALLGSGNINAGMTLIAQPDGTMRYRNLRKEIEVNFGTMPVWDATFTITDATVISSSRVIAWISGNPNSAGSLGEALWDVIGFSCVAGTGSFTLFASALPGPVSGLRKVYYGVS